MNRISAALLGTGALGLVLLALSRPAVGRPSRSAEPASPTGSAEIAREDFLSRGQPTSGPRGSVGKDVPAFWVRPGYRVELAFKAENARFMQFGPKGRLYLSRPDKGDILTLEKGPDGTYKQVATFVSGLGSVHGMDYHDGALWFTQSDAVHWARDDDGDGKADKVVTVLSGLPHGGHWWRSILVTDEGFFTSIGDSGNINDLVDSDREKIWFYSPDGKDRKLYASGLRNTEKLRFRPGTKEVYGMDHGSDWFGKPVGDGKAQQPVTDLNPPDEFNRYVEGGFYGHPFLVGDRVPRYEFKDRPDINDLAAKTIPPAWKFGAHWAANGWTFAGLKTFGGAIAGDAVCAMHGSWNDSAKVGYRIEHVMFDPATGMPCGARMLVGTLDGQNPLARPVDVVEEPGGSLLFSDDQGGAIYRLTKTK